MSSGRSRWRRKSKSHHSKRRPGLPSDSHNDVLFRRQQINVWWIDQCCGHDRLLMCIMDSSENTSECLPQKGTVINGPGELGVWTGFNKLNKEGLLERQGGEQWGHWVQNSREVLNKFSLQKSVKIQMLSTAGLHRLGSGPTHRRDCPYCKF